LSVAFAQELRCRYVNYGSVYGCELTIQNPGGLNNFTQIEGNHLSGYSNSRVGVLYRVSGVTTNVPRIICDTFTNLVSLDLHNTGLTQVDDNAFRGCTLVRQLDLWENSINSISANAFAAMRSVEFLNLEKNRLSSIPADLFANQQNLEMLYLSQNLFQNFPVGIFRPLRNLKHLGIGFSNLIELNNQWFGNNTLLVDLHAGGNSGMRITAQSFVGLETLVYLNIGNNEINQLPAGLFSPLRVLRDLDMHNNTFTELRADAFSGLSNLAYLHISYAPIQQIQAGAFRGLGNLGTLRMENCRLREPQAASFVDLINLNYLDLSNNGIDDLGNFLTVMPNLRDVSLRDNNLRTIRRSNFGTITSLDSLNLDYNLVSALDRNLINQATNFNSLYLTGNICASRFFASFTHSRDEYLPFLQTCFVNFDNMAVSTN